MRLKIDKEEEIICVGERERKIEGDDERPRIKLVKTSL